MNPIIYIIAGTATIILSVFFYLFYGEILHLWKERMRKTRRIRMVMSRYEEGQRRIALGIPSYETVFPLKKQEMSDRIGMNSTIL